MIGLHRVLPDHDPRRAGAMPNFTLPASLFGPMLDFLQAHYNVVSAHDVRRAVDGDGVLPEWPLLLTFDDGWADNFDYAFPQLGARGFPALLFVVADRIGERQGFWQTEWYAALRSSPAVSRRSIWERVGAAGPPPPSLEDTVLGPFAIIAALEAHPLPTRWRLLRDLLPPPHADLPRQMLDASQLRQLLAGGVEIGAHGMTHEPMVAVDDLQQELRGAQEEIARRMGLPRSHVECLSFPHGAYDREVGARALASDFRLLFTSDIGVNRMRESRPERRTLARVWPGPNTVADPDGRFAPDRLAMLLLRQRALALDGQPLPPFDRPAQIHAMAAIPSGSAIGERISVRAAWDNDRPDVLSLLSESFTEAPLEHWSRLLTYPWRDPQRPLGWIAVSEDRVIGFLGAIYSHRMVSGGEQERVDISTLCIDSAWRDTGVGRLLAERFLRDHPAHHITTTASSVASARFWTERGLTPFDDRLRLIAPNRVRGAHDPAFSLERAESALLEGLDREELSVLQYHRVPPVASFVARGAEGPWLIVVRVANSFVTAPAPRLGRVLRAVRVVAPRGVGQRLSRAADLLAGRRSACEILHVSRPVLMTRYAEECLARLFEATGSDTVIVDERRAPARLRDGERIPSVAFHRPPLDRDSVPDALFSSRTLVSW